MGSGTRNLTFERVWALVLFGFGENVVAQLVAHFDLFLASTGLAATVRIW